MKKLRISPQYKPIKVLLGMIVSFVLILSYMVACSDSDPIEDQPLPDPIADEIPDPIVDEDLITVDTDGGVFILPSGIEITVPQGAVTTEKEMKVEVLDLTAVNALAPSPSSENTSILSGISFATDVFDFKEPISLKIPVQNIKAKSLAFLYEFKGETNKWQFSDETMIVSRQDNFVELNLKASDQNSAGKGGGLAAQTPLNDTRNFLVRLFDGIFENEDSCREAAIKAVSTAIDNAASEGCDATMVHEDITFLECGPSVTEAYVALSFSDDCEPELDITPTGVLKVKKGESLPINLFTSIGNFPLSQQKIELEPSDNLGVGPTPIFTDSEGKKSFNVTGLEVGDGEVDVSVTFSYYSTTIYASNAELEEYSPYDPKSGEFHITLNIEVCDKLEVLTDAVTNVTSTTALVSGNVTDDGCETVTERGVFWGKSAEPENKLPLGSGLGGFISNLTDLEPDTDYYVKAYAINNKEETASGEIVSFKTLDEKCEVATTLDTEYDCDSATVGGNVTCEGDATATERGIYLDGVKMQAGSGTGSFSIDLTDLEENTNYTVKAYVTTSSGTEFGEQITFTTPECECEVATTLDTEYDCDSATVGGNVTCEGDATATERGIYLDGVKMQSGSGTGSFSIDLTDLEENTSYTVQAYVTNSEGTEFGEQITFTTPECEFEYSCEEYPNQSRCYTYWWGVNTMEFEYERGNGDIYRYWMHIYLVYPMFDGEFSGTPYLSIKATEFINDNNTFTEYGLDRRSEIIGGCTEPYLGYQWNFEFCVSGAEVIGTWTIDEEEITESAVFPMQITSGPPYHF